MGLMVRKVPRKAFVKARELADDIPSDIKNSIRSGKGRLVGCLGEVMFGDYVERVLGYEVIHKSTYQHDLTLKAGFINITCEVKTKERTVDVKEHYEVTVCGHNVLQRCNIYVFCSYNRKNNKMTLCGWLPRDEYYKKARYIPKGTVDPSNGFKAHSDMYNVPITELYAMERLPDEYL